MVTRLTCEGMGLFRAAAILAIENRFRTSSLELKCLGTSFGARKQMFLILWDPTWPPCDYDLLSFQEIFQNS